MMMSKQSKIAFDGMSDFPSKTAKLVFEGLHNEVVIEGKNCFVGVGSIFFFENKEYLIIEEDKDKLGNRLFYCNFRMNNRCYNRRQLFVVLENTLVTSRTYLENFLNIKIECLHGRY
jgi:hypothetical protein